ncbi:unnamed protein product, partial [Polarella glacialis]
VLIYMFTFYMEPFSAACQKSVSDMVCGEISAERMERCESMGFFILNKDMGIILLTPALVPDYKFIRPVLWSLTLMFYVITMLSSRRYMYQELLRYECHFDIAVGLAFLSAVNAVATSRKWYMQK